MRNSFVFILFTFCCHLSALAYDSKIKFSEKIITSVNISYTDIFKDTYLLHLDSKNPIKSVTTNDALWFQLGKNIFWLLPEEQIEVYGDSLTIQSSPYSANKRNNDLYFFAAFRQQKGKSFKTLFETPLEHKKIKKIAKSYKIQKDSIMAFINAYTNEKPLSDTFKSLCFQYIDAAYAHELLKTVTKMKKKITDLDKKDQAIMDQCLSYNILVPSVEDYIQYHIYLSRKGQDSTYFATEKEILAAKFPVETIERISFLALKTSMLRNKPYTGTYQVTDITNNSYRIYIDKLEKYKDEGLKEKELMTINGQKIRFMKNLQDSANKIHYLCFWNSASPSSVQEIKKWINLANTNSNFHVRIMLISLDENPVTWIAKCKELGIDKYTNNYLAPGNYTSEIATSYRVTTVPRSIVLDAEGFVISLNAPFPTSGNIKYLEERYNKYYAK